MKPLMRLMLVVAWVALMAPLVFAGPAAAAKGGNKATVKQCKQSVLAGSAFRNRGQCVSSGAKGAPPPPQAGGGAAPYSFVSNNRGNSVTEYEKGANGNVAPVATISGPHTQLSGPRGLALDRSGDLVVANQDNSSLTEYPPGATGDAPARIVIVGPQTELNGPTGVAVDATGNLFVSNFGTDSLPGSSVTEYPAGSSGDIEPTAAIEGSATRLLGSTDVALDASGNVFVSNITNSNDEPTGATVTEYARRSSGNVVPDAVIEGDHTGLQHAESLTVDRSGNVFVATGTSSADYGVAEFAKGSNGNIAPSATITGGATGIAGPTGVAVDSAGTVFVTNFGGDGSVTTYASGATGNVAPVTTVTGSKTGLHGPAAIAVTSPPVVPGAPTIGQATAGDASASVNFSPPASNGGSPILSYTATAKDLTNAARGGQTGTGGNSPIVVSGLTNGDSYTFSVTATNAVGTGPPSGPSNAVTPNPPVLFVANNEGNNVTEYAKGANGNQPPVGTIGGPTTGLAIPQGVALDAAGDVFVANQSNDSVTEYAKGANGNVKPVATIAGGATGLSTPGSLVVDPSGVLYVANTSFGENSVTEYAKGANGNVKPVATIVGGATGINGPQGLALDSAGDLYVANLAGIVDDQSVTEYAKGVSGNVAPIATINGPATGLSNPNGVAVDSTGRIYVSNAVIDGNSITEYAKGANGNAAPVATISGSATGLLEPGSLALDSAGDLFVANSGFRTLSRITEYAKAANGNAAPTATIEGPATGLNRPLGVALAPGA